MSSTGYGKKGDIKKPAHFVPGRLSPAALQSCVLFLPYPPPSGATAGAEKSICPVVLHLLFRKQKLFFFISLIQHLALWPWVVSNRSLLTVCLTKNWKMFMSEWISSVPAVVFKAGDTQYGSALQPPSGLNA